jgi:RNA-splicing ligase RtcB
MMTPMSGKDLVAAGIAPGPWFPEAIAEGNRILASGGTLEQAVAYARGIEGPVTTPLRDYSAIPIHANIRAENAMEQANVDKVMATMQKLVRTPVVRSAAVMPDACPAGGPGEIPVGGVVVSEAIHPGMHSADICCSMAISVVPGTSPKALLDAVQSVTHFGRGGRREGDRVSPSRKVLAAFDANPFLEDVVDLAIRHHATQGDGNHFAYVGTLKSTGETALVTHHGSRAPGAVLYHKGMEVADRFRLQLSPKTQKANGWIPADTREGEDYWSALQIIRAWTKENHFVLHDMAVAKIGARVADRFWNEHNFVFRKSDGLFYHGKGATPAFKGWADDATDLTLVPLNMAAPILITRGTNAGNGLGFSPHGAGRNMSRTQHRLLHEGKSDAQMYAEETKGLDARFYSGITDVSELPSAYKNADAVKAQIAEFGLAEVVEEIMPYGSIMAGEPPAPTFDNRMDAGREMQNRPTVVPGFSFVDELPTSSHDFADLTYRSGLCHVFAAAMHRKTGWPLMAAFADLSPSEGGDPDGRILAHCYCVDDDGMLWDVDGSRSYDDAMNELYEVHDDEFSIVRLESEEDLDLAVGLDGCAEAIDEAYSAVVDMLEANLQRDAALSM